MSSPTLKQLFDEQGYVVVPDLFNKDTVPLNMAGFDFMGWLQNHLVPNVEPIVSAVVKALRADKGAKRVGGVGYCFGAKYVVRALAPGNIDVGYVAHPSFVDADELRAIKGPLSIAAAGMSSFSIFPSKFPLLTPYRASLSIET